MLRPLRHTHLKYLEKLPQNGQSVPPQSVIHQEIIPRKYISHKIESIKAS